MLSISSFSSFIMCVYSEAALCRLSFVLCAFWMTPAIFFKNFDESWLVLASGILRNIGEFWWIFLNICNFCFELCWVLFNIFFLRIFANFLNVFLHFYIYSRFFCGFLKFWGILVTTFGECLLILLKVLILGNCGISCWIFANVCKYWRNFN